MSFSSDVKKELINSKLEQGCVASLLCGAILASGSLVLTSGGVTFTMSSENAGYIDFIKAQIKAYYPQTHIEQNISNVSFKQKERIEIRVDSQSGRLILTDLGILSFTKDGNMVINRLGSSHLTIESQNKIAFLRGMFLGCGSVSIPEHVDVSDFSKAIKNSGYHLEWNVQAREQASYISTMLAEFDILSKVVERNESYVVYIKEGQAISQLLGILGAHKSLLNLENERAGREMRNLVNRQANCISANIDKSVNAALEQLKAIEVIKQTIGIESLPESLQEVALARLANPEGSLNEIKDVLEVKVSKGAVSQRFKKIIEIAKEIG